MLGAFTRISTLDDCGSRYRCLAVAGVGGLPGVRLERCRRPGGPMKSLARITTCRGVIVRDYPFSHRAGGE